LSFKESKAYDKDAFLYDAEKIYRKTHKLLAEVEFRTKTKISPRTVAIAEAFGLGVDEEKVFRIYDNFAISWNDGDLIYVTGDSGGGKSVLLRIMEGELRKSKTVKRIEEVEPDPDEILIESIGADVSEAMKFFSMAGLNEAFLVLRRYKELSDGQKYRYRLAKLLATGADDWIMDEFCATLDRDTAKVIAFCVQKLARREGKTVIVATTHRDLIEDCNPNVLLVKGIGTDAEVTYNTDVKPRECSITKDIRILPGTLGDYKRLAQFHYLAGKPAAVRHIFKAEHRGEAVGVMVYTYASLNSAPRNRAFPEYRVMGKERAKRVNAEIVRIARVILHPKYRSIGLGYRLVRETMESLPYRIVETYAVMARYNPFFEKAGMTRTEGKRHSKEITDVMTFLEDHGFDLRLIRSSRACARFLTRISPKTRRELVRLLRRNAQAYMSSYPKMAESLLHKIERGELVDPMMKSIPMNTLYFYWVNPRWKPAT